MEDMENLFMKAFNGWVDCLQKIWIHQRVASHSLRATALQAAENKDLHSLRSLPFTLRICLFLRVVLLGKTLLFLPIFKNTFEIRHFCWVMAMLVIFFRCDLIQSVFLLTSISCLRDDVMCRIPKGPLDFPASSLGDPGTAGTPGQFQRNLTWSHH